MRAYIFESERDRERDSRNSNGLTEHEKRRRQREREREMLRNAASENCFPATRAVRPSEYVDKTRRRQRGKTE